MVFSSVQISNAIKICFGQNTAIKYPVFSIRNFNANFQTIWGMFSVGYIRQSKTKFTIFIKKDGNTESDQ